jgi:tRNA threonylcarbamoyladenosine biosynthesis protein TsaE
MTIHITLSSLVDTATLGAILARLCAADVKPLPLLLRGTMGSGKTTLVRSLVENLPGGRPEDGVEVSSPSFTLCNSYSCTPQVLHFDLFRLEEGTADDQFDEAVELAGQGTLLLIVEWPERILRFSLPHEFILLELSGCENERQAAISLCPASSRHNFPEVLADSVKRAKLPVTVSAGEMTLRTYNLKKD